MAAAIRVPWKVLVDFFKGGVSKRFAFFAIALGLMLLVAIWWVFTVLPDVVIDGNHLNDNTRLQRENDVRTIGVQALAGAVLAIGGAFTAYSVLSTREGQLDERFARALELLASKDAHVVRGAIFSLERIALQSRFDRPAVVDVLSGFVRAGAPLSLDEEAPGEVKDAVRVIARINELWRSPQPDLQETRWKDQLPSLDLSGAVLTDCVFEGPVLFETKFADAVLFRASFAKAHLVNVDFSGARLWSADFSNATLFGVNLKDANLWEANLAGLDLRHTNVDQAGSLTGAKYTAATQFPEGFDPKGHIMVLDEPPSAGGGTENDGGQS